MMMPFPFDFQSFLLYKCTQMMVILTVEQNTLYFNQMLLIFTFVIVTYHLFYVLTFCGLFFL